MLDKNTRDIIRYIRDMQGSSQYKGNDKLGRQFIQADRQRKQGFTIK